MKPLMLLVALAAMAAAAYHLFVGDFTEPAESLYNIALLGFCTFVLVNAYRRNETRLF